MKKTIWGNCIVKNEENYIWFAVKSIINHLDKLIIYDTGSIDKTVEIVEELKKEYQGKIIFEKKGSVDPSGLTRLRQEMLDKTKSDWLLLLDGDEVWWEESIKGVIKRINGGKNCYAIVTPVVNLIGDIFHHQEDEAGEYKILDKKGHFNIRLINLTIPGLHLANDYPLEGFFEANGRLIQSIDEELVFVDLPILHFSHLKRSSVDDPATLHRQKIKIELGESFPKNFKYPEVFYLKRPKNVADPFKKMGFGYKLTAGMITPLKKIKRRLRK